MPNAVLDHSPRAIGPLSVRAFAAADRQQWDRFVDSHADATFFHRSGWHHVIKQAFGHQPHYLLAERDGRLTGILPLFHLRSTLFGNSLMSVPFCVYGGIAAEDDDSASALAAEAKELSRQLNCDYLELRHQRRQMPQWVCKDDLYVTFRKTISSSDEENLAAIPRKQRAMIRKGQKAGLRSSVVTGLDEFYAMYSESVRNLGTPVFGKRYFEILQKEFSDETEIIVVCDADQPVSAVLSFYHKDEVLPYYGGGSVRARATCANDFMYWQVMCSAVRRGVSVFDYGRSKKGTGAYRFKKHWGFEPQPLVYEYALNKLDEIPDISPNNPRYKLMIDCWRKLPLRVTQIIGPHISRHLG